HAAVSQCLQTSLIINQENLSSTDGFSMNATCRHVEAPSCTVLSYDIPLNENPSSGNWFHCLHATSHALQPMHTVVSVKNPTVIAPAALAGCRPSTPSTPGSTRSDRPRTRSARWPSHRARDPMNPSDRAGQSDARP